MPSKTIDNLNNLAISREHSLAKVLSVSANNSQVEVVYSSGLKTIYYNVPKVIIEALLETEEPKFFVDSHLVNKFCYSKIYDSTNIGQSRIYS